MTVKNFTELVNPNLVTLFGENKPVWTAKEKPVLDEESEVEYLTATLRKYLSHGIALYE